MSDRVTICPHCGTRLDPHPEPSTASGHPAASVLDSGSGFVVLSGESRNALELRSGSGDQEPGSSTFLTPVDSSAPDPLLGALAEASITREPPRLDRLESPRDESFDGSVSDSFDGLRGLNLDPTPESPATPVVATLPAEVSTPDSSVEIEYVNGPNWPLLILSSYASAVTLALIWWVVIPRFRGRSDTDGFVPGANVEVGARRADHSRKVEPALPIPADHRTTLGRPITIGSLSITPLDVSRKDVILRRTNIMGETEEKDGGQGALALQIRIRNISSDAVFAPLDEAFLRERDQGLSESFVELGKSERVYLYPLPVESEWSIVGEEFPDLKPGQTMETSIVTATGFPSSEHSMTWRLKLRTGLESTETIGIEVPTGK